MMYVLVYVCVSCECVTSECECCERVSVVTVSPLSATQAVYPASKKSGTSLTVFTLERKTQLYVQHILRQLLRRNLTDHAGEMAHALSGLVYFPHLLELMLHDVLEDETADRDPYLREGACARVPVHVHGSW
jgi:hypothetical protein